MANNPQYIQWVEAGQWDKIVQWDKMDEKAKWNEMWLIGLRTRKGVNLQLIRSNALYVKSMDDNIQKWIRSEHLIIHGNHLTCTPSGWLVMDLILLDFFAVE